MSGFHVIKIVGKKIFVFFEKMKTLTKKLHLSHFFDFFYFLLKGQGGAKFTISVKPGLFKTVICLQSAFQRKKIFRCIFTFKKFLYFS